jgi:hypothetical protein
VEFEVEEDVEAAVAKLMHDAVSGGVVELHAYLEPLAGTFEAVYQSHGLLFAWEVERYGETVLRGKVFLGGGHGLSLTAPTWLWRRDPEAYLRG